MRAVQGGLPAVIKVLLQVHKGFFAGFVVVGPVRCGVKATTIVGLAAVNVPARHAAPGHAVGVGFLVFITQRQSGGIGKIGIDHTIDKLLLSTVTLDITVAILITGHHAAAHVTRFAQRRGEIGNVALFIPAAIGRRNVAGKLAAVSMLTHHVDRGRRIARAGHQAGRPANHFNAFIHRGIGLRIAEVPARLKHRFDAINHVVIDQKAARIISTTIEIGHALLNGGGVIQHVAQRLQLLIFHTLFTDNAHRLWDVAGDQRHLGTGTRHRHAVIAGGAALGRITGRGINGQRLLFLCHGFSGVHLRCGKRGTHHQGDHRQ